MKQKNPKVVYICTFPSLALALAVMIYLVLAKNRTDNAVFLIGGLVFAVGSLLMYLLVGKRISSKEAAKEKSEATPAARQQPAAPAPASPEEAPGGDRLDLREHLTGEEIRILLSDLQVASGKVPADQKAALDALAGEISGNGSIHVKDLPVCVSAVEMGLGVFSAFGLAPAGHSALLDKLKELQNKA